MFKNPMFEWWLESLEDRQLHSSVGSATVETSSREHNAIEVPLIISTPQRHPTDETFVTDWFLSPDSRAK